MPTYIYESIPSKPGEPIRQFEIRHSISSPALTRHPETGEPIRRVVAGGAGILTSHRNSPSSACDQEFSGGQCCGASCACAN